MAWSRWVCVWLFFFPLMCTSAREMNWWGRGHNLPGIISALYSASRSLHNTSDVIASFTYFFLWFSVYMSMPAGFQTHPVHVQHHTWQIGILGMFLWIRRLAQADTRSICWASAAATDGLFSTISGNGRSQCHSSHCWANAWISRIVCWTLKVVLRGEHSVQLMLHHHIV